MIWQSLLAFWKERLGPLPPPPIDPPNDPVQLGAAARALLHDPVFNLAMERIEHRLVLSWKHTADDERNVRELAFYLHRAVQELRAELQRMATRAGDARPANNR
jgi:hypothetical protein